MCVIAGILYFDGRPVSPEILRQMSLLMQERGPDDEGFYIDNGIGLAHRRLSIIDLSKAANCPMENEDGSIQLVYNGEIYNFMELRKELIGKGHCFRTHSDTEVILHGYEEWGESVTRRLGGMFAFAIWNKISKTLFLARDRFGEKPLYYSHSSSSFIFASMLPALACSGFYSFNLNPDSILLYLTHGYIAGPSTIWEEIRQLEPAHQLVISQNGKAQQTRYWEFPQEETVPVDIKDVESNTLKKLENSITQRLVADVPVGGFLSGGVDSSLVMALAAKNKAQDKKFTIGYAEQEFSELPFAKKVAAHIGSEHHELLLTDKDLLSVIPELVWQYGQPYGDSSCIPAYHMSRFARQSVTVCLTGDGGDESFGGYRRALVAYYGMLWKNLIPDVGRKHLARYSEINRSNSQWYKRFIMFNAASFGLESVNVNAISWEETLDEIAGDALAESLRRYRNIYKQKRSSSTVKSQLSLLRQAILADFKNQLPYDFLTKLDVASMSVSLEIRTPFLDHNLVEYVWKLQDHYKIRIGQTKWFLKRLASLYVPKEVIYRRKMGFALPMKVWWKNQLKHLLEELMLTSRAVSFGWIKKEPVLRALEEHSRGKRDHDTRLWLILCLELWARIVIERSLGREGLEFKPIIRVIK